METASGMVLSLNIGLTFSAEDRAENICSAGEVAKLLSDAGVICIASLNSPYRKDALHVVLLQPKGDVIEIILHQKGQVCPSPNEVAEMVVSDLEVNGFLTPEEMMMFSAEAFHFLCTNGPR